MVPTVLARQVCANIFTETRAWDAINRTLSTPMHTVPPPSALFTLHLVMVPQLASDELVWFVGLRQVVVTSTGAGISGTYSRIGP